MKSIWILSFIVFIVSISCKSQKTWKFNTNTCNNPPAISFDLNFLGGNSISSTTHLKIKSDSPITLIIPNVPMLPIAIGGTRTLAIPINSEILVSLLMNRSLISFPTQPNWYELNENIIKKYYKATIIGGGRNILIFESEKKDKEEIKQIICDYWRKD